MSSETRDPTPPFPFSNQLLQNRVILVTGAGGGVGGALAEVVLQAGGRVILSDRELPQLHERAQALKAPALAADLRQLDDIEQLIERAVACYGQLDGLANCAGVWVEGASELASEADWQRCVEVNLKATFFLCSRAIPALKATRGAIVNVSSDAGVVGNAGAAIYCASKGGVGLLSKSLARELAPFGVRVNALCPSDIASPMLQFQADRYGDGDPQAYFQRLLAHYPQAESARFLTPHEVAWQAAWLLSSACAGVTGANVMLDFGLSAGY